ncbi:MAG: hypothetical protein CMJ49_04725 [Planctomycetaceae bacterium]|nr:hypothetical protein [Planctomycetaceae bacterium]
MAEQPPTPEDHGPHGGDPHGRHHDHSHGHPLPDPDAPLQLEDMDAANRSLADALRVSFGVLKVFMVVVGVLFVINGLFKVEENEIAVKLRFGRLVSVGNEAVTYAPGQVHVAWPEPIDRIIKIPTLSQSVELREEFWWNSDEVDQEDDLPLEYPRDRLEPGIHGYLLTGDTNIVHGRLNISYRIEGARDFIQNVSASGDTNEMLARADQFVRLAAQQAAVKIVGGQSVDSFQRSLDQKSASSSPSGEAQELKFKIQAELDRLGAGIKVESAAWSRRIVALTARPAFDAKTKAESEKRQLVEQADTQSTTVLKAAAGSQYDRVIAAIDAYEAARRSGNEDDIAAADDKLAAIITGDLVGGQVARMISEARSNSTDIEERLRAETERFTSLLSTYQETPELLKDLLWQDAYARILSRTVETFHIPPGMSPNAYFDISADLELRRQDEIEKYKKRRTEKEGSKSPYLTR